MSKYHNIKTVYGGEKYDSKAEAHRAYELDMMLKGGYITDLERQVKYPIVVNGCKVCVYIADFRYKENGKIIVEDVKGMKTSTYSLKRKLMKAVYDIDIKET